MRSKRNYTFITLHTLKGFKRNQAVITNNIFYRRVREDKMGFAVLFLKFRKKN